MKKRFSYFFLAMLILALNFDIVVAQNEVMTGMDVAVATTKNGKVRGFIQNNVYTYKGIPYGVAARFEIAKPPSPWQGVRSSTMYGPVSPLLTPTTSIQDESEFVFDHDWGFPSEDCLSLNVWTPEINNKKKRPVLFWIHGGGFTTGSSHELPSYDGENLSKNGDVVVVSINHRLNVLGFLDLTAYGDKYKHSANNSILDMVLALEWVKDNIENFGGDPDNVTIFGQSGGGAKVNTLMAMPKAKGLFHKAINQSGAMRSGILTKSETQMIATETIKLLGIKNQNIDSIQKIPYSILADASSKALKKVEAEMIAAGKKMGSFGLSWGPSVDGEDLPFQILSDEAQLLSKNVPLMIGTVKNEFAPFANMRFVQAGEDAILSHIKSQYKEKADDYIKAAKKAYPADTSAKDLIDIDITFRPGAIAQANIKSAISDGAPVYMYLFTWQSPVFDGKYKALHCMELPFVFDNISLANQMTGGGRKAHILADKMSRAWINFAKFGDPNHDGLPNWPAYNASNTSTMHFDNHCEVLPQLDKELYEVVFNR